MTFQATPFRIRALAIPLLFAGALALGGCEGMNNTQQRTLSGGAIGAGVGAVGTVLTGGCVSCGAASACGGVFSLSSTLETYREGGDGV